MTINDISALISTVGFPICMCGAMFWYMNKQTEEHKTETTALKDAIHSLEIAVTKLTDKLTESDN